MDNRLLRRRVWLLIGVLASLYLTISPLPLSHELRPDFLALLVVYQTMYRRDQMGLGLAFALGLMQDVLLLSVLGQHALGLTILSYVASRLRSRMYLLSPIKQAPTLLLILFGLQVLYGWISAIGFSQIIQASALAAPVLSTLFWVILVFPLAPAARVQKRLAH